MKISAANRSSARDDGFTLVDLLIVMVIGATVISLFVAAMGTAQKSMVRANAAQEFSSFVQQARSDSKKLHATAAPQMAQILILNERYYAVTLDANGDGVLDAPVVVALEDRHLKMDGPFPRAFMFDWLGRTVDASQKLLSSPEVSFSNATGSGKTTVKFADPGRTNIEQH